MNPIIIGSATLHRGDCLDVMRTMQDCSVDSIVTDPPYELGFMGKSWDGTGIAYSVEMWKEALRVLKPGAHLLAFSGSRTYHRMTCAIEDAGFEVRDQIMWVYGSGFPKSKNLDGDWDGWGTALKPAHEPICVARKPLIGTVSENVLAHGTGALNIDGCRVGDSKEVPSSVSRASSGNSLFGSSDGSLRRETGLESGHNPNIGRWPANLIHDGSDEVLAAFPEANGQQGDLINHGTCRQSPNGIFGGMRPALDHPARIEVDKSAARFFYCAKASRQDRHEGMTDPGPQFTHGTTLRKVENATQAGERKGNHHPTVKPTELLRYLWRLVTPPGGIGLDLFMGSGSGGKAAILEGFGYVGIELDKDKDGKPLGYFSISVDRITHAVNTVAQDTQQQRLFA